MLQQRATSEKQLDRLFSLERSFKKFHLKNCPSPQGFESAFRLVKTNNLLCIFSRNSTLVSITSSLVCRFSLLSKKLKFRWTKTSQILNLSNENVRSSSLNTHQSNQSFPTRTGFKVSLTSVYEKELPIGKNWLKNNKAISFRFELMILLRDYRNLYYNDT